MIDVGTKWGDEWSNPWWSRLEEFNSDELLELCDDWKSQHDVPRDQPLDPMVAQALMIQKGTLRTELEQRGLPDVFAYRPSSNSDISDDDIDYGPILGRLMTTGKLMKQPRPEFLVENWILEQSLIVLYGRPKRARKTFLAADIALSVSTGLPSVLGAVRPGSDDDCLDSLYVIGEGSGGMPDRVTAWCQSRNVDERELNGILWLRGPLQLGDRRSVEDAAQRFAETRLIVIDTLARCMSGLDENSTADMSKAVNALDLLRDKTGAAILVVHHSGQDASRGMRGSTALLGAADTVIRMTGDKAGAVRVEMTEQKDYVEADTVHLRLVPTGPSAVFTKDIERSTSGESAVPPSASSVLDALTNGDDGTGVTASAWMKLAGVPQRTFYRVRAHLVDTGQVFNVGTDARPRYRAKSTVVEMPPLKSVSTGFDRHVLGVEA